MAKQGLPALQLHILLSLDLSVFDGLNVVHSQFFTNKQFATFALRAVEFGKMQIRKNARIAWNGGLQHMGIVLNWR